MTRTQLHAWAQNHNWGGLLETDHTQERDETVVVTITNQGKLLSPRKSIKFFIKDCLHFSSCEISSGKGFCALHLKSLANKQIGFKAKSNFVLFVINILSITKINVININACYISIESILQKVTSTQQYLYDLINL